MNQERENATSGVAGLRAALAAPALATRVAALDGLAKIGSADAAAAIVGALRDGDERMAAIAARHVQRLQIRDAAPILLARLNQLGPDSNATNVALMVYALANFPEPAQIPVLAKLVAGPRKAARRPAAGALGAIGTPAASAALNAASADLSWLWARKVRKTFDRWARRRASRTR